MAYNFLDLTNKVIARMNEVPLTSGTFSASRGFQTTCKNAVLDAILYINSREYSWPFNHSSHTEVLVAGTTRYSSPSDSKFIDFDSFRIAKDTTLNSPGQKLRVMDYVDYLARGSEQEDDTSVEGGIPRFVVRTPDNNYLLYPYPDKAYSLKFDYFKNTTELVAFDDVPAIPAQFEHVILDGATAFCYKFRGEDTLFQDSWGQFQKGVTSMQSILMRHYDYAYSGMLRRSSFINSGYIEVS